MRYRYKFENGRHLVCARDDQGNWQADYQEFKDEDEARAAAMGMDMGDVKFTPKPKPDVTTKAGVAAEFKEADRKGSGDKRDWDVDPHDFTIIPGVGDRTAERLKEHGITTLRMLSRVGPAKAEDLGIKDEWIEEAKRLTSD